MKFNKQHKTLLFAALALAALAFFVKKQEDFESFSYTPHDYPFSAHLYHHD